MSKYLKSCPFCGGDVSISLNSDCDGWYWWQTTRGHDKETRCNCRVFMQSDRFMLNDGENPEENSYVMKCKEKLINAWNMRSIRPSEEWRYLIDEIRW